jgi:hypothetical protein
MYLIKIFMCACIDIYIGVVHQFIDRGLEMRFFNLCEGDAFRIAFGTLLIAGLLLVTTSRSPQAF